MFNTNLGHLYILDEFLFFQISVEEPSHFPDSNKYIYGLRNLNFAPSSTKNLLGGGIGMGNTCKPMAVSFQCMTKSTTNKKK